MTLLLVHLRYISETSGSEVSTLLREITFTSDGNDCATHHSRVQLPDDVSVRTKEDHSNARLGLLDLHVSHGLLQEGFDGAPILTLAALVVADTAGTVDEEGEVDQATRRCDKIQVSVVVDSDKVSVTELPSSMLLPMCTVCETYMYFSSKVKPTIVWD